ncbi:MAG: hypothetical protein E5V40_01155 [Mesorhizobium sp.]|nr:MAG: hypothetical protein E5V40_01155 [Mesorhizobium sp.]
MPDDDAIDRDIGPHRIVHIAHEALGFHPVGRQCINRLASRPDPIHHDLHHESPAVPDHDIPAAEIRRAFPFLALDLAVIDL